MCFGTRESAVRASACVSVRACARAWVCRCGCGCGCGCASEREREREGKRHMCTRISERSLFSKNGFSNSNIAVWPLWAWIGIRGIRDQEGQKGSWMMAKGDQSVPRPKGLRERGPEAPRGEPNETKVVPKGIQARAEVAQGRAKGQTTTSLTPDHYAILVKCMSYLQNM